MTERWRELREAMVREQIGRRGVSDPQVLHALRAVPRHLFVPEGKRDKAYDDHPLAIGQDQTISQPYIVAAMTEALEVGAGDRVLEIGAGSGYQAAVLAEVVSEVHTVERIPELADAARARLAALHYRTVQVHCADGALGWPAAAPYDGILVACGAPTLPPALLDQLRPGGKIVIPIGEPGEVMSLQRWSKDEEGRVEHHHLMQVRFVPLIREASTD